LGEQGIENRGGDGYQRMAMSGEDGGGVLDGLPPLARYRETGAVL
jgi:hypothetical protein